MSGETIIFQELSLKRAEAEACRSKHCQVIMEVAHCVLLAENRHQQKPEGCQSRALRLGDYIKHSIYELLLRVRARRLQRNAILSLLLLRVWERHEVHLPNFFCVLFSNVLDIVGELWHWHTCFARLLHQGSSDVSYFTFPCIESICCQSKVLCQLLARLLDADSI